MMIRKNAIYSHICTLSMSCYLQRNNCKLLPLCYQTILEHTHIYFKPTTEDFLLQLATTITTCWTAPKFDFSVKGFYHNAFISNFQPSTNVTLLSMIPRPLSIFKKCILHQCLLPTRMVISRHWKSTFPKYAEILAKWVQILT